MNDRQRLLANHFVRSVPKHLLGTAIEKCDESLCVRGNDRNLRCRIEHCLQLLSCSSEFYRAFRNTLFQLVVCPFLVIYVGAGAHPLDDLAVLISQWKGTSDMPAINTIQCALEPVFNLIIAASRACFRPPLKAILEIVRVQHWLPAQILSLLHCHAGVVEPALVKVDEIS